MATPPDDRAPSANPEAEERIQFMLRLRARGIRDLRLLRALERAPRVAVHAAALCRRRRARHRFADRRRPDLAAAFGGGGDDRSARSAAARPRARSGRRQRLRDRVAGATLRRSRLARAPAARSPSRRPRACRPSGSTTRGSNGPTRLAYDAGAARFEAILVQPRSSRRRRGCWRCSPRAARCAADRRGGCVRPISALSAGSAGRGATFLRRPSTVRFAAFRPLAPGLAGGD